MTGDPENPVAQLIATLASGHGTQADHDRLILKLIAEAQARGASWEQIARLLRMPNGKAARKRVRQLETELRQTGAGDGVEPSA